MKRIVLVIAFVATIFSAQAWTKVVCDASYLIAEKYMTEAAKAECNRILALKESVDYKWVADKAAKVSLDASLLSTTADEKDIVVRIEKAAEVLRNRANHSEKEQVEAIRALYRCMISLHSFAAIRIEGNELTKGFMVQLSNGDAAEGAAAKLRKYKWQTLWHRGILIRHYGFTADMYAEELAICHGKDKEAYSVGSIRDWAADTGAEISKQLVGAEPDMVIDKLKLFELETVNDRMMAKAGYRLAALLNEVLK